MPLLILAPMYNVTDTVFRQIIAECAPPDLFMTEFVNVDGLQSRGRTKLRPFLYKEDSKIPLIAQIWGSEPKNYFKTARELAAEGFAGIDLNLGCPDKTVVKNNNCSALIQEKNWSKVKQIIEATKEGAQGLPVSIKTRLGFRQTNFDFHQFLLEQDLDMLSIHARTVSEMSRVPARWHEVGHIKDMALKINSRTKIIGNGDISNYEQALSLCEKYGWDGAMIGRAIFDDPFVFSKSSPWTDYQPLEKIELYLKHLKLFKQTYSDKQRNFNIIKKFMKVYLINFEQASDLRLQIAQSQDIDQAIEILTDFKLTS